MSDSATSDHDWGHMLAFGSSGLLASLELLILFGSMQETRPYSSESILGMDISSSAALLLLLCAMSAIFGFVAFAILGTQGLCHEPRH
jgi:ABC-type multidrug transport system permease subunit